MIQYNVGYTTSLKQFLEIDIMFTYISEAWFASWCKIIDEIVMFTM